MDKKYFKYKQKYFSKLQQIEYENNPHASYFNVGTFFHLGYEDSEEKTLFFVRYKDTKSKILVISKVDETILPKREFITFDEFNSVFSQSGSLPKPGEISSSNLTEEIDESLQKSYDERVSLFIETFNFINKFIYTDEISVDDLKRVSDYIDKNVINSDFGTDNDNLLYFAKIAKLLPQFWKINSELRELIKTSSMSTTNNENYTNKMLQTLYESFITTIVMQSLSRNKPDHYFDGTIVETYTEKTTELSFHKKTAEIIRYLRNEIGKPEIIEYLYNEQSRLAEEYI